MCLPTHRATHPRVFVRFGKRKVKFGSKRAIFGVSWGGFEGFGPCLGISHPTHPHFGKISQKKTDFFFDTFPKVLYQGKLHTFAAIDRIWQQN